MTWTSSNLQISPSNAWEELELLAGELALKRQLCSNRGNILLFLPHLLYLLAPVFYQGQLLKCSLPFIFTSLHLSLI